MTCIAGIAHKGKVYIGADSAGVGGWDLSVRSDSKVFVNGPYLIGFTSSFRMGQLLRYSFKPPDHDPRKDIYDFMVTVFIDAVRKCLKDGGYASKDNDQESGGTFLVGYKGELFTICSDYQVGQESRGFAAVGCGDNIALGAMYALRGKDPRQSLRRALEAAEAFSAGVRGPFTIKVL